MAVRPWRDAQGDPPGAPVTKRLRSLTEKPSLPLASLYKDAQMKNRLQVFPST